MNRFKVDDVFNLLIVLILYLVAVSGRKKKDRKRAQRHASRSPMRTRSQGERADPRAFQRDTETHQGFNDAFLSDIPEHHVQEICEEKPIHLHQVSQQRFYEAAEGEDPCHAGNAALQNDRSFDEQKDEGYGALAQDVLRGVIMSEILRRPHERAMLKQGRRYTDGS